MGALRAAGRVDIRGLAHVRVTQQGHPLALGLAAARSRVGFPLTAPTALPAGYRLGGVLLQPATRVDFSHLRVAAIDRLLASLGSPQALPAALGSASIALTEPASVVLRYTAAGAPSLEVAEGQTPTLTVPAGVDVAGVRRVLLGLPFLPAGLRRQLRSVADWRHTAIVPQLPGVSQPVSVGGAQGTFVAGPHGGPSMLPRAAWSGSCAGTSRSRRPRRSRPGWPEGGAWRRSGPARGGCAPLGGGGRGRLRRWGMRGRRWRRGS